MNPLLSSTTLLWQKNYEPVFVIVHLWPGRDSVTSPWRLNPLHHVAGLITLSPRLTGASASEVYPHNKQCQSKTSWKRYKLWSTGNWAKAKSVVGSNPTVVACMPLLAVKAVPSCRPPCLTIISILFWFLIQSDTGPSGYCKLLRGNWGWILGAITVESGKPSISVGNFCLISLFGTCTLTIQNPSSFIFLNWIRLQMSLDKHWCEEQCWNNYNSDNMLLPLSESFPSNRMQKYIVCPPWFKFRYLLVQPTFIIFKLPFDCMCLFSEGRCNTWQEKNSSQSGGNI